MGVCESVCVCGVVLKRCASCCVCSSIEVQGQRVMKQQVDFHFRCIKYDVWVCRGTTVRVKLLVSVLSPMCMCVCVCVYACRCVFVREMRKSESPCGLSSLSLAPCSLFSPSAVTMRSPLDSIKQTTRRKNWRKKTKETINSEGGKERRGRAGEFRWNWRGDRGSK